MPDEGKGQRPLVRLQYLAGGIGRSVVGNEEVVLARKRREDLADFPEDEADGDGGVMCRYADIDHASGCGLPGHDTRHGAKRERVPRFRAYPLENFAAIFSPMIVTSRYMERGAGPSL